MLPFSLMQWQYVILALFVGVIMVILLFFAFQSRYYRAGKVKKKEEMHEFSDGIKEGDKPIPVFLIVIYILIGIWGLSYIIMVSIKGFKF